MIVRFVRRLLRAAGFDFIRYQPSRLQDEYEPLRTLGIRTVIDIGAHEGDFVRRIAAIFPAAKIIAFEPESAAFAKLEHALPADRLTAVNCALGAETGTATMYTSAWTQSSSLRPMAELHRQAFPHTAEGATEQVACRRLDEVVRASEIETPLLIKLDVQGYEDLVIAGGEAMFGRAAALIIEMSFASLYEGQPLFDDLYPVIRRLGFQYSGTLYQLTDPRTAMPLQADCLFLKT